VNNKTTDLTLSNGYGQVTLTFNPDLDQEQLPMKRIVVDWDDGTQTDLANLSMLDRPNADNPLQLTHYYYYRTFNSLYPDAYQPIVSPAGTDYFAAGNCPAGGGHACFKFVPRIRVWDNWDWCSGAASGQYGSSCKTAAAAASDWMAFGRAVYVSEP
jgi:hypothetical protein